MTLRLAALIVLLGQAGPASAQDLLVADTVPPATPVRAPLPATVPTDAYRDAQARELVHRARARRAVVDTRITGYETTTHERLSARIAAAGFERLLFRRETVTRVAWTPDTVRIELLGSREVQPMARSAPRLPPPDVAGSLPLLAFDPVSSEMLLQVDSTVLLHPLAPGSEAHYRFARGDSSAIRLPDGRVVRLVELRIAARRPDRRLINGSFWLDADTHAVVRAGFRLSRAVSARSSRVAVLTPEVTADLDHVAIDYGLWDMHWWLPRAVVARGVIRVAGVRFPLAYERSYSDYEVQGDTATAAAARPDADKARAGDGPCRPGYFGSLVVGTSPPVTDASDSAWNAAWNRAAERVAARDTTSSRRQDCERVYLVTLPEGVELIASPVFGADIYEEGDGPLRPEELEELARMARALPGAPWGVSPPRFRVLTPELVRYNRVEGLSLGAVALLPLGPADLRAELRAGTTGEIGARLASIRSTADRRTELAVYRGVEATGVAGRPFSLLRSGSGLALGLDESDYFRGTGLEIRQSFQAARRPQWDVRLFAERQEPLAARATFTLRGLLDDDFQVRENVAADAIDQVGVTVRLRIARGDDPARLRTSAGLELHGETGEMSFARPLVRASADRMLGSRVGAGLSLAAGTGLGEVPQQRLWHVGGASTVRGHDPAALRGESLWLARGEVTWGTPSLRLALFGDAGWAGASDLAFQARPLRGAGMGLSLLDDFLRLDLARGLGAGGFRLHFSVGGTL
jgi:hypothetical protein